MPMRKSSVFLAATALSIILSACVFKKLATDSYDIEFDQAEIERVQDWLEEEADVSPSAERPNVIVIIADDLGKYDISLYGGEMLQTPNIDSIGLMGATCMEGYVTSPICSPSRAGLLTGRYQQRFGFGAQKHEFYQKNRMQYLGFKWFIEKYPWNLIDRDSVPTKEAAEKQGILPNEITIAELLKKSGYSTACIGKWHVGDSEGQKPLDQGFDRFYGFYASHSLFAPEKSEGVVDQKIKKDLTDKYIWRGQRDGIHAIYDQDVEIEENEYLTYRIAEESIKFIKEHNEEPFFLYASFNAPHTPLQAPEKYVSQLGHIEDPVKRVYNGMIWALDDAVGDMMTALREEGLLENTIIFFISDNGGANYTFTTDNAPLKGGKITGFEGGLNVPFLVRWDGMIEPGTIYDQPVISLDIAATAAQLAGVDDHPDYQLDGTNLVPHLMGADIGPAHEALYWKFGWNKIIRKGDWKLMLDVDHGYTNLYNVSKDKFEKDNLAETHPGIVRELTMNLHDWEAELPEELWPPIMKYMYEDEDGTMYYFAD